ncbi:hypothetical protein PAXRUDRAFT_23723 [Paxillus rubicundulus Ve08.2h10]|uniref:SDR family NAD(P)-dependent oxidoreductase n=1 Tax=Paxillus rubicundulus Ve08.2h10 TaxID=930991 RepID=A0A0D0DW69_9AGAM|nr:hypothetical protein PAXRUDRAFT_23723 [Paxillus rubicundulus Ve08.2h10]
MYLSAKRSTAIMTGASAGFGRAVTEEALQKGDNVIATLRTPEVLPDLLAHYSSQLLVLALGFLTQIAEAFEQAFERYGHIDIVINNISVIQTTLFRTNAPWANTLEPIHPACDSDPRHLSRKIRNLYDLGDLAERRPNPPFYLSLYRMVVQATKEKETPVR